MHTNPESKLLAAVTVPRTMSPVLTTSGLRKPALGSGFVLLLALGLSSTPAAAQTNWTNTTNSNAYYRRSANWSGGLPSSTGTAIFNQAPAYQVWWDNQTATNHPAVGTVQILQGNVTFLNESGGAQHLFTINGSGGEGSLPDFLVSGGPVVSLTNRGLHLLSRGGGQIIGGTLTLDGSHELRSRLTVDGAVGFDVSGNLNVLAGAVFNNTSGQIAGLAGSTGSATVTGSDSQWIHSSSLSVGSLGSGTLNVEAGGLVSNTLGVIGSDAGSTGSATVSGSDSRWNNSSNLFVGAYGNGTLNVEAGGVVSNAFGTIGSDSGSTGTATVTGSNSQWNSGSLKVGDYGNGTLNVEAGGLVSNPDGYIGFREGSTGSATVTGSGSQWNNSEYLCVGQDGNGTLNVQAGGLVSTPYCAIGRRSGSTGIATVTGSDSQWDIASDLSVGGDGAQEFMGSAGGTGSLNIYDSGLVHVGGITTLWGGGSAVLDDGGVLDTQTLDHSLGSFQMLNGGVLHAVQVLGDLTNAGGVLAPGNGPGITQINGTYVQGSAATLRIELGGTTEGLFDQLFVTGNANLDGLLEVSLTGGFSPGANQQFLIAVIGGNRNGLFSGLNDGGLVGTYGGRALYINYGAGDGNDIALYTLPDASAYATWALTNAPSGNPDGDDDRDGVSNAVEFVLGGTSASNDPGKLPKLTATGGNLHFTFDRAQASIAPSTTVVIEVGTDLQNWPSAYSVPADATVNDPGVTVEKNTSPGSDTVTLSVAMAPDTLKFARLKVVVTP